MRQWLIGLGMLGVATATQAATWTCSDQVEALAGSFYLVVSRCEAAGAYTTAGDTMGDGSAGAVGAQLCNSAQRHPQGVMVGNTADNKGAKTFAATWDQSSLRIMLATAPATGAPGTPLAQVASGTALDGFTLRMLAVCK
ncbi:MAG TPA: hypothetical protein VLK79_12675 [Gaiellales bacterium]|nr:hypothetical protein [Gaiellales bacterium]